MEEKRFLVIDARKFDDAADLESELNARCGEGWMPFQVIRDFLVLGKMGSAMSDVFQVMKKELGEGDERSPLPPGAYWDDSLGRYVAPDDPAWRPEKFEELSKPRIVK